MGMNDIGSLTHKMELQKSYCVCPKVQEEGILHVIADGLCRPIAGVI